MKKFVMLLSGLVFFGIGYAGERAISVPSDAKAHYFVLEQTPGPMATITTKRVGSSGISFSKRLYDCQNRLVKYLATGDSLEALKSSKPDPNLASIVPGSIADDISYEACD